jgi:hypothetical protein
MWLPSGAAAQAMWGEGMLSGPTGSACTVMAVLTASALSTFVCTASCGPSTPAAAESTGLSGTGLWLACSSPTSFSSACLRGGPSSSSSGCAATSTSPALLWRRRNTGSVRRRQAPAGARGGRGEERRGTGGCLSLWRGAAVVTSPVWRGSLTQRQSQSRTKRSVRSASGIWQPGVHAPGDRRSCDRQCTEIAPVSACCASAGPVRSQMVAYGCSESISQHSTVAERTAVEGSHRTCRRGQPAGRVTTRTSQQARRSSGSRARSSTEQR